ncbi:tyrosine-type recombinase/integrase [Roseomonas mucosa]|uniref:site-specific integrase n=1 Tax=Roseomonas mucosa TaxID=207340 RepID=UPI0030CEB9A2
MTSLRLPYIHRFRDRHGQMRHYFRKPGFARISLPGLPGSPGFLEAYQAAAAGHPLPIGTAKELPGSLSALISAWYGSSDFKRLAPLSAATYRNILERLRAEHGDKPVARIEPKHIRRLVAARAETPTAANRLRQLLRQLMQYAVEDGWRKDDPTQGVRKVRHRSDGFHSWTEEEIAAFEAKWPLGTRARLALALLLYTGQRRGDVVRMGRQHVRNGAIEVVQGKTGARLAIPIHADLSAALAAYPSEHLTFLTTRGGASFSGPGFSNWFVKVTREAGLPKGCSPHGLRKAAARRLADAGCSSQQIKAFTGHTTLSEVERYTRAADQVRLAEVAVSRIGRAKTPEA